MNRFSLILLSMALLCLLGIGCSQNPVRQSEATDQADYEQNIGLIQYNLQLVRSLFENPLQIQQTSTGDVDLNDFFDLSSIGGLAPEAVPMTLPNNVQATPIASTQIIEQISYLNKEDTSNPAGDIRCMDKSLLGAYNAVGESLTERFGGSVTSEIIGIFPKGGPRQNTWLNIRDDLTKLANIIEVGILTIPNGIS